MADSMFGWKVLRLYGLTWCQLKGVFKQSVMLQTCQPNRPLLPNAVFYGTQASNAFDGTPAAASGPVPFPDEQQQQLELMQKGIGRYQGEQDFKLLLKPDQPEDARILRVAIIGLPNSGKSTLTNSLMGWRVSSVSKKVHTTRKNTTGILTRDKTQIVFLDTPGILHPTSRKRHNLDKSLVIDPERSLHHADLVCVLVDVANKWTRNELDPLLLQVLHLHQDKPAVLVLNKVDLLRSKQMLLQTMRSLTQGVVDGRPIGVTTKRTSDRRKQLDFTAMFDAMESMAQQQKSSTDSCQEERPTESPQGTHLEESEVLTSPRQTSSSEMEAWTSYFQRMQQARRAVQGMKGWPHFKRVFMVSALSADGVADMKDYLLQSAKPGDWEYHSSLVTLQSPQELVLMCVREKLLEHLKQEIPYNLTLDIVMWEVDEDGMFNIIININTQNSRQVSFLLGPRGRMIQKVASEAKQEIMNAFRCEMRLKLIARVYKPNKR